MNVLRPGRLSRYATGNRSAHTLGLFLRLVILLSFTVNAGSVRYAWTVVDHCRADDADATLTSCLSDLAWSRPVPYAIFAFVTLSTAGAAHASAARLSRADPRLRRAAWRLLLLSVPMWLLVPWSIHAEPVAVVAIPAYVGSWVLLVASLAASQRRTA